MNAAPRSPSRLVLVVAALLFLAALAEGGYIYLSRLRDPSRARAVSPVLRGEAIASSMGCFGCHGPAGLAGIPDPGARGGETPAWAGGTYMMFNQRPEEIREWILDGAPKRLLGDAAHEERRKGMLIKMPAYRGRIDGEDLDDLVAYVAAVSAAVKPPQGTPAAEGRDLAVANGCFGCHGPEGRGLLRNPGSFKGYVPAWDSEDYPDLVRNPAEFREWVALGEIRRFRGNPAAAHFLDAQIIKMPAFREQLNDDQIEKIRAYVEWVRSAPRPAS